MGAVSKNLHIDKLLSEMAIGYRPDGFIADMIFPTVRVGKQSDLYTVFSREDRLRIPDTTRTPGQRANRITEEVGSGTFYAKNYALSGFVPIEDKANADPLLIDEMINGKAQLVLDGLMLDWENRVSTKVTNTSNVGSFSAVGSAWNLAGDPLGDVNAGIDNVHYSNGVKPNVITFAPKAWDSFRRDSTVRNLISGTDNGGGYPNTDDVAKLLNIEKVLVAGAFKNSSEEGIAESIEPIWKDQVLISYTATNPSRDKPSFGYNFRWVFGGLPDMMIERHPYDNRTHSEEVEAGYYQDEVITGSSYGFLITGINSSQ